MNATQTIQSKITANVDDDQLIFMGLISQNGEAVEHKMVTAAIVEELCDRHPEIEDQVNEYMGDFNNPLTFIEFLAATIKK